MCKPAFLCDNEPNNSLWQPFILWNRAHKCTQTRLHMRSFLPSQWQINRCMSSIRNLKKLNVFWFHLMDDLEIRCGQFQSKISLEGACRWALHEKCIQASVFISHTYSLVHLWHKLSCSCMHKKDLLHYAKNVLSFRGPFISFICTLRRMTFYNTIKCTIIAADIVFNVNNYNMIGFLYVGSQKAHFQLWFSEVFIL